MFYTFEKIVSQLPEIRRAIHRGVCDLPRFKYLEAECEGAHLPSFDDRAWADFTTGSTWGGYDKVAWFRTWVEIPPEWRDKKLALRFLVGPRDDGGSTAETMLYVNGKPLQGIDVWHEEAWLPPEITRQGRFHIALKAWSGVLHVPERRRFKTAQLLWIDEPAECFYYLADTLAKSLNLLAETDLRRVKLLEALNLAFLQLDFGRPRSPEFYISVAEAGQMLSSEVARWQARELKPKVTAIGHTHIDMAWLWRLAHTREKAARSFATVLHLMRQYPEYRFMHSSPQLYQFLKEDYPEIYAQVKARIEAGQWEITGGMWIEADTNLTSGESLVRQFLHGKRFMRTEFGVDTKILWLPDVFGYSAALPQIARKSGIPYFLTTKISWNQFNRFPYDTFQWRGIDGTELLTHFITTPEKNSPFYTYNGACTPEQIKGLWDTYRQKGLNDELLMSYGWGDGGGGPTKEMLETARAMRNLPGLPEVQTGLAEPYFERLQARLEGKALPVWDGELYLELHRGTYTSQAANKQANRQAEILYHDAELLSAMADALTGAQDYPAAAFEQAWERILLLQFHDILPGSSIRQVYEDTAVDYRWIHAQGQATRAAARQRIADRLPTRQPSLAVFNTLGWRRDGLVELPWSEALEGKQITARGGDPLSAQVVTEQGQRKVLFRAKDIPSLGYAIQPLEDAGTQAEAGAMIITPGRLENAYYAIRLNERGQITSLWDKRNCREVLPPGSRANVLQAFEDKPMGGDAWDIDIYYQEKMKEVSDLIETVVEEEGPLRGTLRLTWRYLDSTITQRVSLYATSPRLDFRTEADWHQRQTLLKVAFPVEVRSTRATYEIQFGSLERPTHWNTSWDWARFEVSGHKWADLSEGDYGVALLNDCKYGYDVKNNVLRLTLIKSAISPDPEADQGQHEFTYSLLPHTGDWRQGRVPQEAYELNLPLQAEFIQSAQPGDLTSSFAFAEPESDHVIVETVKRSEQGDGADAGAYIFRVYEYQQSRLAKTMLHFGLPIRKAVETNLVEDGEQPVKFEGNCLEFAIQPFEIKTFKVWF